MPTAHEHGGALVPTAPPLTFHICFPGLRGADTTALLPPTDGRVQLLLQPHAGGVGVALSAQLLPLQVSLPAVEALTASINAVFFSEDDGPQQPQPQQQHMQRPPQPSPAAVAAAATFIIEDASAKLPHHGHASSAGAPAAAAAEEGPQLDDLAAALFTYVHSSGDPGTASRPAPLQVQTYAGSAPGGGDAAPRTGGLGARLWAAASGAGQQGAQPAAEQQRRQGIRWCYPQPREVALVAIEVRPACGACCRAFEASCRSSSLDPCACCAALATPAGPARRPARRRLPAQLLGAGGWSLPGAAAASGGGGSHWSSCARRQRRHWRRQRTQ